FGSVVALDDVSLVAHRGRVHALLGENGAGKSTLLGVLGGSHHPGSGALFLDGERIDLGAHTPRVARELGVSIVHQELALLPAMSVTENIFLGRELCTPRGSLDRAAMRRRAREVLDRLGARLDVDRPVERLSVAESQLVEIARALTFDTKVVALDEPSAVLAGDELEALFAVVRALRDDGVAVIYVSHRLDEVFEICDDFTVLKDGRVAGSGQVAGITRDDVIRMMVGRDVSETFPGKTAEVGAVALEVSHLSVPGLLHDISFQARAGEILGLAGLIGSGRSTLAKAIFGAVPAVTGRVVVDGQEGPFPDPRQALRAGIAYLPEDRKLEGLALEKSVRWNLSLLVADGLRGASRLIDERWEREIVADRIDGLDIRTRRDGADLGRQLSGGNQQKVVVGKWLLADPRVLLLDEPTRGIDVGAKEQIYHLLRELADQGLCVVVISSELIEIVGLCDRVLVLCEGHLAGELTAEEASEEAIMRLATPTASKAAEAPS
ncbi:MAG: sugar ABC transporter ATP-binding protein, partial [Nitriliruptorales bacterium]